MAMVIFCTDKETEAGHKGNDRRTKGLTDSKLGHTCSTISIWKPVPKWECQGMFIYNGIFSKCLKVSNKMLRYDGYFIRVSGNHDLLGFPN